MIVSTPRSTPQPAASGSADAPFGATSHTESAIPYRGAGPTDDSTDRTTWSLSSPLPDSAPLQLHVAALLGLLHERRNRVTSLPSDCKRSSSAGLLICRWTRATSSGTTPGCAAVSYSSLGPAGGAGFLLRSVCSNENRCAHGLGHPVAARKHHPVVLCTWAGGVHDTWRWRSRVATPAHCQLTFEFVGDDDSEGNVRSIPNPGLGEEPRRRVTALRHRLQCVRISAACRQSHGVEANREVRRQTCLRSLAGRARD